MDIDILLILQGFREGVGSVFTDFLSKMTFWGDMATTLVVIAAIYWCLSKDFGTYLLMGFSGNRLVNGLLKIAACVYRPWIRDPRIVPEQKAFAAATGYSFPSGHSMNGATLFGGIAVRKELPKVLRISCALTMVLIAFSRPFLGVHTPQDVLVGLCAGLLVMWLMSKLLQWVELHPEKDIVVAGVGIALAVALGLFAALKSYPVDYDADGKLLVDGAKMANDTFKGVGWAIAFFVGWVLERRFGRFSTEVPVATRLTRLAVGVLSYYAVALILVPLLKNMISGAPGTAISCFLQMFFVTFIFPWCLVHFEKQGPRSGASK